MKPVRAILESQVAEKSVTFLAEKVLNHWVKKRRASDPSQAKVSIVIPIYNVERYLSVCIRSALAQTHGNIEVILVDDGSTDKSGQIAKDFATQYTNVLLVSQKHAGLSAARNAGVGAIKNTDFLLFLDSDDLLPRKAVANYLKAIGELNLAVGKPKRLKGLVLYKRNHNIFREADKKTDLVNSYRFLSDVTAWNKFMRFDFWQSGRYTFPVGLLYEDMALMTRIYAESGGFAVVNKVSYYWRERVGTSSSITQNRGEIRNLEDRLKAIEDTLINLRKLVPRTDATVDLWNYFFWAIVAVDFRYFIPWVPHTDQHYFDTFQKAAQDLYSKADSIFWETVPDRHRFAIQALVKGTRDEVVTELKRARIEIQRRP
jgi:CDP-glycerol glycerophosphotransferase